MDSDDGMDGLPSTPGGGTPVQDEPANDYNPDDMLESADGPASPMDASDEDGPGTPLGSPPASPDSQPVSHGSSRSGSPTGSMNGSVRNGSPSGSHRSRSRSPVGSHRSGSASPAGSVRSGSADSKGSHSGSGASRSVSPAGSNRSRSASPGQQRSPSGSPARSRDSSPESQHSGSFAGSARSGSPGSVRSRSASPAGSHRSQSGGSNRSIRSGSGSPASRSPSVRSRSRSRSPAGSFHSPSARSKGSPHGSPVGSPQSSSGSRNVSPVGSHRSRSGSVGSGRSRSPSPAGSYRSDSAGSNRSRSGSVRSGRGSMPGTPRSDSPQSRSVSPTGSQSGGSRHSRDGSHSRSRSPASRTGSVRSRSGSRDSRDGSPRRAENSDAEGDITPVKKKKKAGPGKESGDESGKESEVGELIADIFGSSDEDEEFEGFGDVEAPPKKEKRKTHILSDDEDDDDAGDTGPVSDEGKQGDAAVAVDGTDPTQEQILPELSSDEEGDEAIRKQAREGTEDFTYDFDLMLAKKKEEQSRKRRRRKDVDVINDNDDLIAAMIQKMKTAAEEDRELNQNKQPATKKLAMLPKVQGQLKKVDLQLGFLDCGVLTAITEWLAPLPDKSLPHLRIRQYMLQQLADFPPIGTDQLKSSGIGKAVMYLYKHPKEIRPNKELCGKLINDWSRPIFNLTSNYSSLTKEEREQRDYEQLPKRRRLSQEGAMTPRRDLDKAIAGEDRALRPGDVGFVVRARVPQPSKKDYVVRPKWNVEEQPRKSGKKSLTRYEKHQRSLMEKKKRSKTQRAVTISIEGRNMAL